MLERLDVNFAPAGSSHIVGIDTETDSVAWTLELPNAGNCGGMALSPSGKSVIVSCSGGFDANGAKGRALVLIDAAAHPPKEIERFAGVQSLAAPLAPSIAFVSEKLLLGVAYGDDTSGTKDVSYSVDIDSGDVNTVTQAGGASVVGDVLCFPGCTNLCFVADADLKAAGATTKGAVRVYDGAAKELSDRAFAVDPSVGLPPRALGAL
jgi:hypothetical protein